ncbi:MAG: restriction endonuclease [Deltaproteobacteria bacterium]|nr:restriction endonuclease [Deltaproteobacteria bacterium]
MECWFWNIDIKMQSYFSQELDQHRLRQGWGYADNLDLRKLKTKVSSNNLLDSEEQAAWNRCNTMLEYIKEGDLIAVKNVPVREKFTIVRVTGGYSFDIDPNIGDYGHFLPVDKVVVYNKYSKVVPAPFINALNRERNPIRITYKHQQTVRELASIDTSPEERDTPEQFKEKVAKWRINLLPHLKNDLKSSLSPAETERLILEMLRRDGVDVLWNAGPWEQGADLLCDVQLGYGLTSKLAIQVKMHWGETFDTTGIDQLEQAFSVHGAQGGILVITADKLGENVIKRIDEAQKKHNIQIIYGEELFSRLLELIADSSLDLT